MLNIRIKTIPHKKHRYPTIGDYFDKGGVENILVSDMANKKYEFLVAVHELIEKFWAELNGVKDADITAFDIAFEEDRVRRLRAIATRMDVQANFDYVKVEAEEPGDDPEAPYYRGHQIATSVERILAYLFDVNWEEYNAKVVSL